MAKERTRVSKVPQYCFIDENVIAEVNEVSRHFGITKQAIIEQGVKLWLKAWKSNNRAAISEIATANNG